MIYQMLVELKLNSKLHLKCKDEITILRNDDIIAIIKTYVGFKRW